MANSINFKFLSFLKDIPESRFYQMEGLYSKKAPCCVGAHIAHELLAFRDYEMGISEVLIRTGLNIAELIVIFRGLGIKRPFGCLPWGRPVAEVIEDLIKVEKKPSLKKVDLSEAIMSRTNLRRVNFTLSDMRRASFYLSMLSDISFKGANLTGANFKYADLVKVDFTGACLRETWFKGVNMKGTAFYKADLREARIPRKYYTPINDSGALNIEKINWV